MSTLCDLDLAGRVVLGAYVLMNLFLSPLIQGLSCINLSCLSPVFQKNVIIAKGITVMYKQDRVMQPMRLQ